MKRFVAFVVLCFALVSASGCALPMDEAVAADKAEKPKAAKCDCKKPCKCCAACPKK